MHDFARPTWRRRFEPQGFSLIARRRFTSVPQRLSRLKRVLDAFQRLGLAAEAQEDFAFEVQDVLLGDKME